MSETFVQYSVRVKKLTTRAPVSDRWDKAQIVYRIWLLAFVATVIFHRFARDVIDGDCGFADDCRMLLGFEVEGGTSAIC